MTEILALALSVAERLPPAVQDELGQRILDECSPIVRDPFVLNALRDDELDGSEIFV